MHLRLRKQVHLMKHIQMRIMDINIRKLSGQLNIMRIQSSLWLGK